MFLFSCGEHDASLREGKAALEYLWRTGEVAITRRDGFEKVYDLAERVFPGMPELEEPEPEEHVAWACTFALERLGVSSIACITPYQPVGDEQVHGFFTECGYDVRRVHGLRCETATSIADVTPDTLVDELKRLDGEHKVFGWDFPAR